MPHRDPDDPPRRRANKRRGHGTFANDRPPVAATIGRDSGRACLHVVANSDRPTLEGLVQATTAPGAMLHTDEWRPYGRVNELGRGHATVNHGAGEWARDDDGDGVRDSDDSRCRSRRAVGARKGLVTVVSARSSTGRLNPWPRRTGSRSRGAGRRRDGGECRARTSCYSLRRRWIRGNSAFRR